MNKFSNNAAMYVLNMCIEMVGHYTEVIGSCNTIEHLTVTNNWICAGFKNLESVIENLPRRSRRKLCLSFLESARSLICNVSLSKSLDITFKKVDKVFDRPPKFEPVTGKTLEELLETLKRSGANGIIVKMERVKHDKEEPSPKTTDKKPGSNEKKDPETSQ